MQERALQMLLVMERIDGFRSVFEQIKIRALEGPIDQKRLHTLFSDYFPADPFEGAYDESGNIDPDLVDEDEIAFAIPASAQEDDEISAWIRERERGSVSTTALGEWV